MAEFDISSIKPIVTIGDVEIIDSGSLLVTNNEVIEFTIKLPDGNFLYFKCRFAEDNSLKNDDGSLKPKAEYDIIECDGKKFMDIVFINMNDVSLMGNTEKIQLATISGHPVTFRFRLSSVGKAPVNFVFNYTWFLEPKTVQDIEGK